MPFDTNPGIRLCNVFLSFRDGHHVRLDDHSAINSCRVFVHVLAVKILSGYGLDAWHVKCPGVRVLKTFKVSLYCVYNGNGGVWECESGSGDLAQSVRI